MCKAEVENLASQQLAMASVGRITVVAPLIAKPAGLLTLHQPHALICLSSTHSSLTSQTSVRNVLVHCARHKGQIRVLSVTTDPRQHAKVSSCKTLGEQATTLSSTIVALAATTLVAATCVNEANAVESLGLEAGAVFERTCAACHSGGGNILQPAATLFKEGLEKNGVSSVDDIYNITYFGKNRMPGYGEKCTPRGQCTFGPRLSEENIRALAEFVKLQANQGWPK